MNQGIFLLFIMRFYSFILWNVASLNLTLPSQKYLPGALRAKLMVGPLTQTLFLSVIMKVFPEMVLDVPWKPPMTMTAVELIKTMQWFWMTTGKAGLKTFQPVGVRISASDVGLVMLPPEKFIRKIVFACLRHTF